MGLSKTTTEYNICVQCKTFCVVDEGIGITFFLRQAYDLISDLNDIQLDDTFQTVLKQLYQMWTILFSVSRHSLPTIHLLMKSKEKALYSCTTRNSKLGLKRTE